MKLIILASILVLLVPPKVQTSSINVGTVLFTQMDMHRSCWTIESIAVLTTRMMLEDLMPAVDRIVIENNDFINNLMGYFKEIARVIRERANGRKKHIILLAFTDVLGGYLKSIVLPRAKRAYYAGLIDFSSLEKLLQLFNELKWFLRTNGVGWAKSIEYGSGDYKIAPINMEAVSTKDSCNALMFFEKPKNNTTISTTQVNRGTDLNVRPKRKAEEAEPNFIFPMPFFDSRCHPNSIAVPFKYYSLRPIESKKSSNVVLKYFTAVYQCMAEKKVDIYSRQKFYNEFLSWIDRDIMPKLDDERVYAAFGGIYKVGETLKEFGAQKIEIKTTTEVKFNEEGLNEVSTQSPSGVMKSSNLILLAVLIAIFVWFLLGIMFICYRIRAKKSCSAHCTCSKTSLKKTSSSSPPPGTTSGSDSQTYTKCTCTKNSSKTESKTSTKSTSKDVTPGYDTQVATIETVQTMKLLPSIAEISETSYRCEKKHYDSSSSDSSSYTTEEEKTGRETLTAAYSTISHDMYLKTLKNTAKMVATKASKRVSGVSFGEGKEKSTTLSSKNVTYSTDASEDVSKTSRSSSSLSSCLKKDKKDTSDYSTDATSQMVSVDLRKNRSEETTSYSSESHQDVSKQEMSVVSLNDDDDPTPETSSHSKSSRSRSESLDNTLKQDCIFGYDFHTSSSGDSSIDTEESITEMKKSPSK